MKISKRGKVRSEESSGDEGMERNEMKRKGKTGSLLRTCETMRVEEGIFGRER